MKKAIKTLRECLIYVFKQPFLVFKQHFTYFHIFSPTRISTNIFKKKKISVFKHMYQTDPIDLKKYLPQIA